MTDQTVGGSKIGRCIITIIFALLLTGLGIVSFISGSSLTSMVASIFSIFAGVTGLFSLFYFLLEKRGQKAEAADEVLKASYEGRSELFDQNSGREVLAFNNFCSKGVPVITFVLATALVLVSLFVFQNVKSAELSLSSNPLRSAAITLVPMFLAFFGGSYFSGLSRENGMRWFRSQGCWLLASAFGFLASSILFLLEYFSENTTDFDAVVAKVFLFFLGAIGVELVLGVILDIYRPDFDAKEKPAYESKLLTIIFQPGGVAKNIAEVINYQFGFTVSDTWFFKFIEKMLLPFVLVTLLIAYLMGSVVYIDSDSQGIKETFGKVTSRRALTPGVYFKLPYPFGEIRQFPVKNIQEFNLGYSLADDHKASSVIVWNRSHVSTEENFLLPDSQSGAKDSDSVAVSFVTVRIPVRFVVKDLYKYLYNFRDAKAVLKKLAQAEVVEYLASSDFFTFLNTGRLEASEDMTKLIQKAADKADLGVEIVYVNLLATHPPVVVGDAFQSVTSAMEKKEALILDAMAYANRTVPEAKGKAAIVLKDAEAYRFRALSLAKAEVELFKSQSKAHKSFEKYYEVSKELEVMESTKDRRKYVVPENYPKEIYDINLEDKSQPDLMDLEVVPNM